MYKEINCKTVLVGLPFVRANCLFVYVLNGLYSPVNVLLLERWYSLSVGPNECQTHYYRYRSLNRKLPLQHMYFEGS